jgi:hypothetical protein
MSVVNDDHKRRNRRCRTQRTPRARLIPLLQELVQQLQITVPTLVTLENAAAVPALVATNDSSKSLYVMVDAATSTDPIRVTEPHVQPLYFHATAHELTMLISA